MKTDNIKTCTSCGKTFPAESTFCTDCGARLSDNQNRLTCKNCGEPIETDAVFCTNCGSRCQDKARENEEDIGFSAQFMGLACEYLSVVKKADGFYEFSSITSAQSPTQKAKVSYEAIAMLDPEKRRIIFWEKMVERSSGMKVGFYSEKYVQKGKEVSKEISGNLLMGGKYGFEYGKLRDVIKAMATIKGWKFKTAIFRPKIK